ncbi:MAG: hypothetical protein OHK0023_13470 [Anaerolineae bacterium]
MSDNLAQSNRNTSRQREKMGMIFLAVGAAIIVLVIALVVFAQGSTPINVSPTVAANLSPNQLQRGNLANYGFPQIGDPKAPIILIEFSNFSCPGCAQYHATVKQIIDTHVASGRASFVFAPMVWPERQPSVIAAVAALCADQQGKFWEMADTLISIHLQRSGNAFDFDTVNAAATALEMDSAKFATCMAQQGGPQIDTINASIDLFVKLNLQYTPSLLYSKDGGATWEWFTAADGTRFEASVPLEDVTRVLAQMQ